MWKNWCRVCRLYTRFVYIFLLDLSLRQSLTWGDGGEPEPDGVSFSELAMAFMLETGVPIPHQPVSSGHWAATESGTSEFTLFRMSQVMFKVFEFLQSNGVLPRHIGIGQCRALWHHGYRGTAGRSRGLLARPYLPSFAQIAAVFRPVLQAAGTCSPQKRSFSLTIGSAAGVI